MSNVDYVVAQDGLHPSTVVSIEFAFEEAITERLTVGFEFDG